MLVYILFTLTASDIDIVFINKLKWLIIILFIPFHSFTNYECFFPDSKKIVPKFLLIIAPFFIIFLYTNYFLSLPVYSIEIDILSVKFIYKFASTKLIYYIYSTIMYLSFIVSIMEYIFSKNKNKKIFFVITLICMIISGANDMSIKAGLYKSIMINEFLIVSTFIFIFMYFILENKKTHLAVVDLSKELQQHKEELEVKVEERTKEVVEKSKIIEQEKAKVEDLLHNVLPIQIVREYNETGLSKPVLNENATIVFTDFVSFSKFAEGTNPNVVVESLDKIFSKFDDIVKSKNLEKLKTIGDSYMFAGGLFSDNNQLSESLDACFDMVDYIMNSKTEFIESTGYEWSLRIGIHTGPVVTGLIGKWRFLYDTWGNTVNIASRLEGASDTNKINTSKQVYELLNEKNEFAFEYRGTLPIKNMNPIEMYFVERRG